MTDFWKDKRIVVTGGNGFLGSHIVTKLIERGAQKENIIIPRSQTHDLRDRLVCQSLVNGADVVIHSAVTGGGIGFNLKYPGEIFYNNIIMNSELMEAARQAEVKTFVGIGTICSYPKLAPIPFQEADLWSGYPEETNGAYGLSKKMMLVQSEAYQKQYGWTAINLLLENMYGPGDDFKPESSHVIPALIKKIAEAKKNKSPSITVWGTGEATRGFLFVRDAADGVVRLAEKYRSTDPINVGSGEEISIKMLTETIKKLMNYEGELVWDETKPNGQPRRSVDTTKAETICHWKASTPLSIGLQETINWYHENNTI